MTADDLIEKYAHDKDVDHEALKRILEHGVVKSLEYLDSMIERKKLLCPSSNFGWVTRTGVMYNCGYGGHESLLDLMGIYTYTAEQAGWIRVSGMVTKDMNIPCGIQATYKPTSAQKRTLRSIGAWEFMETSGAILRSAMDDMPVFPQYER